MRLCEGRERKEKLPKALFEGTAIVQRTAQAQLLGVSAPTLWSPLKAALLQWGGFTPLHWAHLSPVGFYSSLLLYIFQAKSQPQAPIFSSPQSTLLPKEGVDHLSFHFLPYKPQPGILCELLL